MTWTACLGDLARLTASLPVRWAFPFINCYTLAWLEGLRHGGQVVEVSPGHYGLKRALVTVHYVPHFGSWWGWRRLVEINTMEQAYGHLRADEGRRRAGRIHGT